MKKTKTLTTYEREMQDPEFRKIYEKGYKKFALEQLMLAIAAGDEKSVRVLAKETGMHPNAIQNLRTGKTSDIKLKSFIKIIHAYGYSLQLVKGRTHITLPLAG
jgi:DNA-binding Xre family transcriptional regulator